MYVLGIDAGTQAVKAGLFDLQGTLISVGSQPYKTTYPRPGWAEQSPDDWWSSLVAAIKTCLENTDVDRSQIKGISADATTCTLVPMRANGEVLRPALLWMDVRSTEQAQRIFQTGHDALRYSLAGVSAEWMPPKMLWLKENEPETYQQMDYLLEYTAWIAYRLTGRFALDINTVTHRWFYHAPSGGWDSDFFNAIGLEDIEEKFPKDILAVGEYVGNLTASVAEELGLSTDIPVLMGGGDAFIGLLGLGVTSPGDLGVVMGSSNVLSGLMDTEVHFPGIFGTFPEALIPGLNLIEGGQVSTGSILNWFKQNFAIDLEAEAQAAGTSPYTLLEQVAQDVPVGSEGLVVLDYFQGNRTPHTDSSARGLVLGLSLQSSRSHLYRALMEGIAYGMKDILDTFEQHECHISRVIACGGAVQSKLFMQIYTDVIGQPIYTTAEAEASLLGSGVAAAYGAGLYPSLPEASRNMVKITGEFQPDMQQHEQYKVYVETYKQAYQAIKDVMHRLTQHAGH